MLTKVEAFPTLIRTKTPMNKFNVHFYNPYIILIIVVQIKRPFIKSGPDHSDNSIKESSSVLSLRSSLIPYPVPSVNSRTSSSIELIFQQRIIPPLKLSFDPQC